MACLLNPMFIRASYRFHRCYGGREPGGVSRGGSLTHRVWHQPTHDLRRHLRACCSPFSARCFPFTTLRLRADPCEQPSRASSSSPLPPVSPWSSLRRLSSLTSLRCLPSIPSFSLSQKQPLQVCSSASRPCASVASHENGDDFSLRLSSADQRHIGVFYSKSHEYVRLVLEKSPRSKSCSTYVSSSRFSPASSSIVCYKRSPSGDPLGMGQEELENVSAENNREAREIVKEHSNTADPVTRDTTFLSLVAYIGVTSFVAKELGEVVYVEFPQALSEAIVERGEAIARGQCISSPEKSSGHKREALVYAVAREQKKDVLSSGFWVDKGTPICSMESVKSVAEAYSPVSGEIIEVNEKIKEAPKLVFDDPEGEGWLVKLRLFGTASRGEDDPRKENNMVSELVETVRRRLLDEAQYARLLEQEARRFQQGDS